MTISETIKQLLIDLKSVAAMQSDFCIELEISSRDLEIGRLFHDNQIEEKHVWFPLVITLIHLRHSRSYSP